MSKEMVIDYEQHYDEAYWTSRKKYLSNGKELNYHGPALQWDGFELIAEALAPLVPGKTLLDIGCGAGDLAKRLMNRGFDAYGVDVSQYAVANAVVEMSGRIAIADITTCPELKSKVLVGQKVDWHEAKTTDLYEDKCFPTQFDVVMATDLLEHIFEEDLERTFDWIMARSKRWLFFCVAVAQHPTSPMAEAHKLEFVHKKGEPVPPEFQPTAISGHVNVRHWKYWANYFLAKGLRIRWDLMYMFQMAREMNRPWANTMGWSLQTTWLLEKKPER